tara:strand:- start:4528 stop:5115 length:588 start_codon:yes stop_codon:yes gene_type:complete
MVEDKIKEIIAKHKSGEKKLYSLIKIKELQENERIYFFGLGFIQIKLSDKYRIHFYNKKLPSITDSIHNHRYDFNSYILKGEFTNQVFKEDKGGELFTLNNESCNPEIEAPELSKKIYLTEDSKKVYKEGESYFMDYTWLHKVESDYAITLLERSNYKQEFAQIALKENEENICAFSKKIDEKLLWSIIGEMLND